MRCLAFQHARHEGLGLIRSPLEARGWEIDERRLRVAEDVPDEAASPEVGLLIVLGGPVSLYEQDRVSYLAREIETMGRRLETGLPTLGLCLGAQMMAAALGARVFRGPRFEVGWHRVWPVGAGCDDLTFRNLLTPVDQTLHWHQDTFDLPPGCERLASSALYENQAFRLGSHSYGIQFHPEVPIEDLQVWVERTHIPLTGPPDSCTGEEILEGARRHADAMRAQTEAFMDRYLWGLEGI